MRHGLRIVLFSLLLPATTACDPVQRGDVAIRQHGNYLIVRVADCGKRSASDVTSVTLKTVGGTTLWAIEPAGSPKPLNAFILGISPPGFTETSKLEATLQPDTTYGLTVRIQNGNFLQNGFKPGSVRADKWLNWKGQLVTNERITASAC